MTDPLPAVIDEALPVETRQPDKVEVWRPWVREDAIALCVLVEQVCPRFGCHVALTGGLLYKVGPRKDCDLLFYRIREVKEIDKDKLWEALDAISLEEIGGFGWCHKAKFQGKSVDCFFPEEDGGAPYSPLQLNEPTKAL